jgi:hypothetical protein
MLIDIAMAIGQLVLLFLFLGVVLIIVYQLNKKPAQRQFDADQKAIHKRRSARKTTKRQRNTYIAKLLYFVKLKGSCYSCHKDIDHLGPRKYPVCMVEREWGGWKSEWPLSVTFEHRKFKTILYYFMYSARSTI